LGRPLFGDQPSPAFNLILCSVRRGVKLHVRPPFVIHYTWIRGRACGVWPSLDAQILSANRMHGSGALGVCAYTGDTGRCRACAIARTYNANQWISDQAYTIIRSAVSAPYRL
jgi:hypothetical protein